MRILQLKGKVESPQRSHQLIKNVLITLACTSVKTS